MTEQTLIEKQLAELFINWCGKAPNIILPIPPSASYRRYFRLANDSHTAIGAYNSDLLENKAFLELSAHFRKKSLPVPEIYGASKDLSIYLQQDLGDLTLFDFIYPYRNRNSAFTPEMKQAYLDTLDALIDLQIKGFKDLDFSVCYPSEAFDKQSMMWDCNYFKYNFLKFLQIDFDQHALEEDFNNLTEFLLQAGNQYFMHRDCQARNIMLFNNRVYFIDYQGGRKGPLQYDLASLLYQARSNLTEDLREEFLHYYLGKVSKILPDFDPTLFRHYYDGFVLLRCMQLLGAYGFRGLYERKQHFINSIPLAAANFIEIANRVNKNFSIPSILAVAESITGSKWLPVDKKKAENASLKVMIYSFSYRKGIPKFESEHGGGFVFDCRALQNPGRLEAYKYLNGLDKPVADFLKAQSQAEEWLSYIFELTDRSVEEYLERDFNTLTVAFGCTGGQHRSVFCAEELANHLSYKYGIKFEINHSEQKNWLKN